jgi:hypothetical protein
MRDEENTRDNETCHHRPLLSPLPPLPPLPLEGGAVFSARAHALALTCPRRIAIACIPHHDAAVVAIVKVFS